MSFGVECSSAWRLMLFGKGVCLSVDLQELARLSAKLRMSRQEWELEASLSLLDTSAFFRYFSMSRALRSPRDKLFWRSSCWSSFLGWGVWTSSSVLLLLECLFLDNSMIIAASWAGSELIEASAMADAIVLILSVKLPLEFDSELWLEFPLWSSDNTGEIYFKMKNKSNACIHSKYI